MITWASFLLRDPKNEEYEWVDAGSQNTAWVV